MRNVSWLLFLSLLSACDDLVPMEIVPIKYAPTEVIYNQSQQTAANPPTAVQNGYEQLSLEGCWQYQPEDPAQPIQRRLYETIGGLSYNFSSAQLETDSSKVRENPKGLTYLQPSQKRLMVRMQGKTNYQSFIMPNPDTLEIEGQLYQRIQDIPCWPGNSPAGKGSIKE